MRVTDQRPERPPAAQLIRVLGVPRNAKIGAIVGVVLAVAVYVVFVVLPRRTAQPATWYLALAFVVAVSTALFVTVALTVRAVARHTMSPPKWIRRGGTGALLGGGVWLGLGVAAPLAEWSGLYARALPLASLSVVAGVWALHAAHRRRYGDVGLAGAVLSGVGVALVGWIGVIEPLWVTDGGLSFVEPTVFLGIHLVALGGTTLLGVAVLRVGALPDAAAFGLSLALPVALLGFAGVSYLGRPALVGTVIGATVGLPWALVGHALRNGRGVPPADAYDRGM